MKNVYGIAADEGTTPFDHIHCANEEAELRNLLERNLDLIPGDQVDPEGSRRWLLVKRELTVEDPGTAEGRCGRKRGQSSLSTQEGAATADPLLMHYQ